MRHNKPERNADRLDQVRAKVDTKMHLIIREQEQVIEAANKGIDRLNEELRALKRRLEPKMTGPYDETYYSLKDRYQNKIAERATLQTARTTAEESITAAKLHMVPGEYDRGDY